MPGLTGARDWRNLQPPPTPRGRIEGALSFLSSLVDIVGGQATIKPVLVQSEKVTIVADGKIDLGTDGLEFSFNTRPRTGVGVSAGMFTNPFIELGGTLANPKAGVGERESYPAPLLRQPAACPWLRRD